MALDIPRIPLGPVIEQTLDTLSDHLAPLTKSISATLETAIDAVGEGLLAVPPCRLWPNCVLPHLWKMLRFPVTRLQL